MKNEFIPYQQALALKELGFDEPCLAFYIDVDKFLYTNQKWLDYNLNSRRISAPLYQQAFRWFREKYRLYPIIDSFVGVKGVVKFFYKLPMYDETFDTYEEAESACLDKLIEIIKTKTNEK